jgi:hypothetical protein
VETHGLYAILLISCWLVICDGPSQTVLQQMKSCPNCQLANVREVREVTVLRGRIKARLHHCNNCDFLFLGNPFWLPEAYKQEFFGDTGYIQRNLRFAKFLRLLFLTYELIGFSQFRHKACDLGAGLGMLPRLMRDYGYDYWGSDAYSGMQLIQPFVNPKFNVSIKSAFEVVEHVPALSKFLEEQVGKPEIFIFSTLLRNSGSVPKDDWWYYTFEMAQHISFHSSQSLALAFNSYGLSSENLISHGNELHAWAGTDRWRKSFAITSFLMSRGLADCSIKFLVLFIRRKSLVWEDHLKSVATLSRAKDDRLFDA